MSRDDFDSASAYVAIKDLLGELVLFSPTEYVEEVKTDFGDKDAIITNLVVLTQAGTPEFTDAMIFQGSLIGALKRKLPVYSDAVPASQFGPAQPSKLVKEGRKLLGVIGKGEAKKGQNAPYILIAPTDEQKQIARDYLAGRTIEQATDDIPADDPFAVKPQA